jgi:ABC-type Fe3+/spermidine/putrescine transport system ATPase subunit
MELAFADRVAVLALGKIQQEGDPVEIYRRPRTRVAGELLSRANVLTGRVRFAGAGEFVADTLLGEVRGALADASALPQPGAEMDILIRPESLHLDLMPPDENVFAGTVAGGDFWGATGNLVFQTNAGVQLRVLELGPRVGGSALAGGGTLYAWVAPEDVTGILR